MGESIEKQEINPRELDDLMLAQEIKTITSQGIRLVFKEIKYNKFVTGVLQILIIYVYSNLFAYRLLFWGIMTKKIYTIDKINSLSQKEKVTFRYV